MRWIIGIFIILDVIYQLLGVSNSVSWWLYYDLIHYALPLGICLHLYFKRGDKLIGVFSLYFAFVFLNIISQIGLSKDAYLKNVQYDYDLFAYFAIFILILFTINKLWERLKKTGY